MIERARRGDLDAFNHLVLDYQSISYNVAYRILGNRDDAADATQDAFLSAFRAISGFRSGSSKSWILRIVTNACYDQLRWKQRRPTVRLDDLPLEADCSGYIQDLAWCPDKLLERRQLNRAIQAGILTLPPKQRIVLVLSDIHGLSYGEIAETIGIPTGTVRSRLSRGRTRLRTHLSRELGKFGLPPPKWIPR